MSLVSVIIPNYNHAHFLKERIDSVLGQSYKDIEVIILDDCSTDSSKDVIERYRNIPVVKHVVYNDTNSGSTFRQWKKGIELASGDWIWIAESDDVADSEFLSKMLKVESQVSIRYCNSLIIDDAGEKSTLYGFSNVPYKDKYSEFKEGKVYNKGKDFLDKWILKDNFIPNASAVLFKKELTNEIQWEELIRMKIYGDWFFWIQLLNQSGISYTSESLNLFRNHCNTVRESTDKTAHKIMEFVAIIDFLPNKLQQKKMFDTFMYRYKELLKSKVKIKFSQHLRVLMFSIKHNKLLYYLKTVLK